MPRAIQIVEYAPSVPCRALQQRLEVLRALLEPHARPLAGEGDLDREQLAERHIAVVHEHHGPLLVPGRLGDQVDKSSNPSENPVAGTSLPRKRPIMPS